MTGAPLHKPRPHLRRRTLSSPSSRGRAAACPGRLYERHGPPIARAHSPATLVDPRRPRLFSSAERLDLSPPLGVLLSSPVFHTAPCKTIDPASVLPRPPHPPPVPLIRFHRGLCARAQDDHRRRQGACQALFQPTPASLPRSQPPLSCGTPLAPAFPHGLCSRVTRPSIQADPFSFATRSTAARAASKATGKPTARMQTALSARSRSADGPSRLVQSVAS